MIRNVEFGMTDKRDRLKGERVPSKFKNGRSENTCDIFNTWLNILNLLINSKLSCSLPTGTFCKVWKQTVCNTILNSSSIDVFIFCNRSLWDNIKRVRVVVLVTVEFLQNFSKIWVVHLFTNKHVRTLNVPICAICWQNTSSLMNKYLSQKHRVLHTDKRMKMQNSFWQNQVTAIDTLQFNCYLGKQPK